MRLAEHDGDLLHWFYDQDLVPGTEVVVESADPAADQFVVRIGERHALRLGEGGGGAVRQTVVAYGEPGSFTQRVRAVGALPREVVVVPAEVAVCSGFRVDRTPQVEVAKDRRRTQVEMLAHERLDLRHGDRLRPERLDEHRERMRDADRVRDLDLAALREPGRDDVLRDPARGVRGRAVDLRRILARERAAAVRAPRRRTCRR